MIRNLKLEEFDIVANACIVHEATKEKDFDIEKIVSVNLKNSKGLELTSGDFGIAIYNEDKFGLYLNWKDYEKLKITLKISEEEYDQFLDNITANLVDSVIKYINKKD